MTTKKKAATKNPPKAERPKPKPPPTDPPQMRSRPAGEIASQIKLKIQDGIVLIGGDGHYIPDEDPSTGHRAFVHFIKRLSPRHVIVNGDVLDASSISRHARIGWELRPALKDEIEVCQERMHEIELAAPRGTTRSWTIGNHDQLRFDSKLSNAVPEFFGVQGFSLADHFNAWNFAWSVEINDDVVAKHRWKGGVHAPYNNCVNSGKTIITGHLHSGKVIPFSDYSGTRYGVDHGCLADPKSRAFTNYTESNSLNWRSGFAVLTFHKGRLLFPELVSVFYEKAGLVQWRGELIRV